MKAGVCPPAMAWVVATMGLLFSIVAQAVERVSLEEAARRLDSGGWVMMMRHAATEAGIGDPPDFRIGDCGTQRNLSDAGRDQARRAGVAMRAAGIRIDEVRTSQWCRCRETAELAFGTAQDWPALNSFFADRSGGRDQTAEVLAHTSSLAAGRNLMLVTHQVNITALAGGFVVPGEVVVGRVRNGDFEGAFRFQPDEPDSASR